MFVLAPDFVAKSARPVCGTHQICAFPGTKNLVHQSWMLLKNYSLGSGSTVWTTMLA